MQCGMTKTDAAAQTLSNINPDVKLEAFTYNITTVSGFDQFKGKITSSIPSIPQMGAVFMASLAPFII